MSLMKKSVSSPKFLLTKKEITEDEYLSMQNENNKNGNDHIMLKQSQSEHLFSFLNNNHTHSNHNNLIIISPTSRSIIKQNVTYSERQSKENKSQSIIHNQHYLQSHYDIYNDLNSNDTQEEKERILETKMKDKIEQQVRRELYKSQYPKVFQQIKNEIYNNIVNEIMVKQEREIRQIKNKLEYSNKQKLIDAEKQLTVKYKEECDKEKRKIVKEKEKEFKTFYDDKFIAMKSKAKNSLIEKYNIMQNILLKELDDMKEVYKRCIGKTATKNIQKGFDITKERADKDKLKDQETDDLISICKQIEIKTHKLINSNINNNLRPKQEYQLHQSNSKSNLSTRNLKIISNSNITQLQTNNSRSINLFELNNKIKLITPRSYSCTNIKTKKNPEYYYNFPLKR